MWMAHSVGAVWNHFFTLLAGCVATVLLALFQKFVSKREIPNKIYTWILLAFLFFACLQAIRDEHNNTEQAINGPDGKVTAWAKYNQCDKERFGKATLADQLQGQVAAQQSELGGQQDTFNKCLLALGLQNKPAPARITTRWVLLGTKAHGASRDFGVAVALTDKAIPSVNGVLSCKKPFTVNEFMVAGDVEIQQFQSNTISDHEVKLGIAAPWTPTSPFIVLLMGDDLVNAKCTFTQQS
jgi:hypothetical protein